ncbi:PREDICTED: uncharacterized protein LOC108575898 [Habropoda laboriosa]|uniref:uncharacterized protein LOC108575898 n=1 Tax=Habropoda laboriosa TaxID=597456 RepID=UPI00083CC87D|nr:PREDICTED: uncharacterized protein LOC108575898 [Habropoda laboriosa]
MEGQLKALVAERGAMKSRLTRFKRFMETSSDSMDVDALEKKTNSYADLHEKFDKVQCQIEAIVTGSDAEASQFDERDDFEGAFFPLITRAEKHILHLRGSVTSPSTVSSVIDSQNTPRLPTIVLPTFDGRYDHWVRFRDTFLTMVHNNCSLTDIQRFHYLNSALKGVAARTVESLGVSEANYKLAWANLKRRFEDPDSLIHHHVNALIEIPTITHQTSVSLREFIDKANNQLVALGALGEPIESWDTFIIILLAKKLDAKTFNDWDTFATNASRRPKFNDFVNFLERQAKRLERATTNPQTTAQVVNEVKKVRVNRAPGRSNSVAVHVSSTRNQCVLCKGEHLLQYCTQLKEMSTPERQETVKRLRSCFNCLNQGHGVSGCTRGTCRKCGKRHHTLLHQDKTSETATSAESSATSTPSCVSNSASAAFEYTVLSTAVVYIKGKNGQKHKCRALLDVGSQANFITDELCKRLDLNRSAIKTTVGGLGMSGNCIRSRTSVAISSMCNNFRADLSCLVIDNITEDMPNLPTNLTKVAIPASVTPADPHFDRQSRIDLLIGAGLFWKLLCIGQHKVESSDLVWQKTRLGWVLGGSFNWSITTHKQTNSTCHTVTNADLNKTISQFWEIEEIQPSFTSNSNSSTDPSEVHFDHTTTRDETGRYTVSIPFNNKLDELGQSRTQAKNRLLGVERRFLKDHELQRQYTDFMTEYEALGHMTRLTDHESVNAEPSYYLPHHAVFKQSSSTTKIRVVFDGSAKSSSGVSLNDTQLVGPTVQSDLFEILIRFRKHRLVLSADIAKMYRQVLVHPENRRFQRILWRANTNDSIHTFELNTVTYGTASAPFLATRVLRQIGLDHAQSFPTASRTIVNDFYVDDLLTGCETISEAIELRRDLTRILEQAGFSLIKWASNNSNALESLNSVQGAVEIKEADQDTKTLGLLWIADADELHYSIRDHHLKRITKRSILSEIAQIFDPLGLIGPVVTRAKLFMQNLWQLRVNWDETLPQDLHTQWSTFREQLQSITSIIIPRRVISDNMDYVELHAFSDASERAYGGCVYLRTVDATGDATVRLLCAKSRVAPLKSTTLPRLELCGALLASQLAARVKCIFQMDFAEEHYWSDSTIVLAWLGSPPTKWTRFVANRVSEIQGLTASGSWNCINFNIGTADMCRYTYTVSSTND